MKQKYLIMLKNSKVVILTDLHLRSDYLPGFLERQVETLLGLVNKKPCSHVVINGDIFERRNPQSEEVLAFDYMLDQMKNKEIIINRGNHDTMRKDGTSDTTLSVFSSKARVVKDTETIRIGSVDFDFIPHYEDEDRIIEDLKATKNPVFGHFGYDGCIDGAYAMEARVKHWHFKKKPWAFLGHIHRPNIYKNVVILGTQYSNTFGEPNAQKYIHELVIRDGDVEMIRKPIEKGIKHLVCTLDELPQLAKKHRIENFFTLLRVKLDRLDSYTEERLKEELFAQYPIQSLDLVFEDVFPKFDSDYTPEQKIFSLDEKIIDDYINNSDTVFTKPELLDALEEIKDAAK